MRRTLWVRSNLVQRAFLAQTLVTSKTISVKNIFWVCWLYTWVEWFWLVRTISFAISVPFQKGNVVTTQVLDPVYSIVQRWQLKTSECHSKRGGGERTDQSESAACPPHRLSHTIDMAFGDWSCHLKANEEIHSNKGYIHTYTGHALKNVRVQFKNFIGLFFKMLHLKCFCTNTASMRKKTCYCMVLDFAVV
jgi:hypothetical protein